MLRLVKGELAAVGQPEARYQTPSHIVDVPCELDPLALQLAGSGLDVVTHEVQLMAAFAVSWMYSQLGGRQREDRPTASRIDRGQSKHVTEEGANAFCIPSEDDRVNTDDHCWPSLPRGKQQSGPQPPVALTAQPYVSREATLSAASTRPLPLVARPMSWATSE